ncbi:MAG: TetR/AcrR family transcriptional regulator [Euryarchaeota archaeon]|nr:TetR/AcrR family transcriptional regulator [Euryarchaeota archaeon]
MQTLKKDIEERILNAACGEFAEHGFAKAKMRSIAARAGVSTGNLYTYFPNKDDLFRALVAPTVDQINEYVSYDRIAEQTNCGEGWTYYGHREFYLEIADFHDRNRKAMELLLFRSQGSSLEGFREDCIRKLDETIPLCRDMLPCKEANGKVDEFLWHSLHSFVINTFAEMIMHDLDREEMMRCAVDLATYLHYGWRAIVVARIEDFAKKNE